MLDNAAVLKWYAEQGLDETIGEERDDPFDAAVALRRDGEPGRTDLGDAHGDLRGAAGLPPYPASASGRLRSTGRSAVW